MHVPVPEHGTCKGCSFAVVELWPGLTLKTCARIVPATLLCFVCVCPSGPKLPRQAAYFSALLYTGTFRVFVSVLRVVESDGQRTAGAIRYMMRVRVCLDPCCVEARAVELPVQVVCALCTAQLPPDSFCDWLPETPTLRVQVVVFVFCGRFVCDF